MPPTPPAAPVAPQPPGDARNDALFEQLAQARAQAADAQLQASLAAEQAARTAGTRALPRTAQELAGVRKQREEMSNQLVSAQGRRREVARALERAENPANRAGLEGRLRVLDQRIAQIESDIAETGRLITSAPPGMLAGSEVARNFPMPDRGPPEGVIAIIFILFVLFPIALAASRGIWRRSRSATTRPDPLQRESAERLVRLEQAVDAIAVEVERVSEGQRFVTRLLAESRGAPAIPAAAPNNTLDVVPRYSGQS